LKSEARKRKEKIAITKARKQENTKEEISRRDAENAERNGTPQ